MSPSVMSLHAAVQSGMSLAQIDFMCRTGRVELFLKAGKVFLRFLK